jgi:hypothetical protein
LNIKPKIGKSSDESFSIVPSIYGLPRGVTSGTLFDLKIVMKKKE